MTMTGKAVWVTGGASGIGAAVVEKVAAQGRPAFVADASPVPSGRPVAGSDVVDVRDRAAMERSCARAAEQGLGLAVLCAGVGFTDGSTCDGVDPESYQRMVDINLTGVVHGIAAATPHLRAAGGGSIVVLASLAGIVPQQGNPFYSMTKAGLIGLVRALGPDLAAEGIRIAAVCPGFADTPMITSFREVFVDAGFPLLTAENVADAVLHAAEEGESGTCWVVQPGREPIAYAFRGVPGAMKVDGSVAAVPASAK